MILKCAKLIGALSMAPASLGALNVNTPIINKASELDMSPTWNNYTNDYTPVTYSEKYWTASDGITHRISFSVVLTPNSDTRFSVQELSNMNTYYRYAISFPFKVNVSLVHYILQEDSSYLQVEKRYKSSNIQLWATDFNGYVLPKYGTASSTYLAYIMKGNLKMYITPESVDFILGDLKQEEYSVDYNNQIYIWNWLNSKSYQFTDYLSAADLTIDFGDSGIVNDYINFFKEKYGFSESFQDITLDFEYNNSINNTKTAWDNGYEVGRDLQNTPMGLEWVKGAISTLEGFLNINLGFFNLGQLLGGLLVIVIVLWILRWFI